MFVHSPPDVCEGHEDVCVPCHPCRGTARRAARPSGTQPELHEGLADPYGDLPSALYVELHDDDKDYDYYN